MAKKRKQKSRNPRQRKQSKWIIKSTRVQYALCVLAIALLASLIYHNSLDVPAVFDDETVFDNPDLRDLGDLPRVLRTWEIPRPVLALSFALNYYWGGADVFGYHVVNVLLHIANGILLFAVLLLTLRNTKPAKESGADLGIALAAALIFISHPIQTESVTYIGGRSAVLCALFYLLTILLFIKANVPGSASTKAKPAALRKTLYVAGAALSFTLALGTKVVALSLPAVFLLYDYFFLSKGDLRRFFRQALAFHMTFLVIAGFRIYAHIYLPAPHYYLSWLSSSSVSPQGVPPSAGESPFFYEFFVGASLTLYENALTQCRALVDYLTLLFFPVNQSADWGYTISRSIGEPSVLVAVSVLLAVLVLALFLSRKSKVLAFGVFWYFITMALFFVQPLPDIIVERRLYIPGMGFCLFFAVVLYQGFVYLDNRFGPHRKIKYILPVFLAALIGLYSFKSIQRNIVWQDPYTLWQEAAQKSPVKTRANNNYGIICMNRGDLDDSVQAFQRAVAADSTLGLSYTNLLSAYCVVAYKEKTEASIYRAVDLFREILASKPHHAVDWYIKNYPQLNKPLFNGVVHQFEEQLQATDSRDGDAYIALGLLYDRLFDDNAKARAYFEKGTSLGYSRPTSHYFANDYVDSLSQEVLPRRP